MTKDEALKQALQALESHIVWFSRDTMIGKSMREKTDKAIAAIKEALAQPAPVQEPVVCKHEWFRTGAMEPGKCRCIKCGVWNNTTSPQRQWVGLTRKEVYDLYDSDFETFHQSIETKLKELNT